MSQDRRTKDHVTPGQDPREIDRERTTDQAVEDVAGFQGIESGQEPIHAMGTSSDAPGRDLDDLESAPEVPHLREQS